MTRGFKSLANINGLAFTLGLLLATSYAAPAYAEKCPFSAASDPHDRDENDPPLKCRKCEEIAEKIARKDSNVWTLDLKYSKPRRVEVKGETGTSEVYWFVYYELTNIDEIPHPCFVDVMAESDKGKNVYTYHDSAVPEVVEEVRKIEGVKDGETLFTMTDLCLPPAGSENKLPNKTDGNAFEQTYEDGRALTEPKSGKPSQTRFLQRMTDAEGKTLVVKDGPAHVAYSMINPGEKRRCVAIFEKMDSEMDVLTVYFHGLCNSTYGTSDPASLPPEANPVGDNDLRIINDDVKAADPYRRKVIDRIFTIEYECLGDEFAKSSRQIKPHEEQPLRPRNLSKEEDAPRYHDVGIFGTEIVEPEEKTVEGKKGTPYTFVARKWIQVERTIKSDLR